MIRMLCAASVVALIAVPGMAATFHLDESSPEIGGDYNDGRDYWTSPLEVVVGTGRNTATGSLWGYCTDKRNASPCGGEPGSDTTDWFRIIVPEGHELTEISASVSGSGPDRLSLATGLRGWDRYGQYMGIIGSGGRLDASQGFVSDFEPIGPGEYHFSLGGAFSYWNPGPYGYEWAAEFLVDGPLPESEISAVPVPAALPLLLAGFGMLGLARRKRG